MGCTTVDHVYPAPHGKPSDGTPCCCGKRRWNQDGPFYAGPQAPAKPITTLPRRGSRVRLDDGTEGQVDQVDRAEQMFHVEGKGWFEPTELVR